MDFATDRIFESLYEEPFYFELDNLEMSNYFMSANTPPYDGSELEDEELLDKFLSDSAALDENDCLSCAGVEVCPPPSTCTSPLSVGEKDCDAGKGSQILTDIAMAAAAGSAKKVNMETNESGKTGKERQQIRGKEVAQNRNAIIARENRERKKLYIKGLEESVANLKKENEDYKSKIDKLQSVVDTLSSDAAYLRSVLHNQSDLAKVLQAVSSVPGMKVKPSLRCVETFPSSLGVKRPATASKGEPPEKTRKSDNAGICLHIQNGSVSFELCSHCNAFSSAEDS